MSSISRRIKKAAKWVPPSTTREVRESATAHRYIEISRFHRNVANAERYVLELFHMRYPGAFLPKVREEVFRAGEGKNLFEIDFKRAVQEARERGTAESLRSYLNGSDPYFVFTMSVAADGEGPTIQLGFAGQHLKLQVPMRQGLIEAELTDDILEHRRRASECSLKGFDGFQGTAMHFRGYLLSSCALVEAFLNRCVLIDSANARTSPGLQELQKPCSVERKFGLWLMEFCGEPLSAINSGVEWAHYQELRRLRNSLMHATHSMLGIGLKETARQLNLVRSGVGGLINLLRKTQSLPPVPFAEQLETAPETRFVSETNGNQKPRNQ